MPALALAIAASVAAGVRAQRRFGAGAIALARRLLDALLDAAMPFIVFFVLARAELTSAAGFGLLPGYASLAIVAYTLATRVMRLPAPAGAMVVVAATMGNCRPRSRRRSASTRSSSRTPTTSTAAWRRRRRPGRPRSPSVRRWPRPRCTDVPTADATRVAGWRAWHASDF